MKYSDLIANWLSELKYTHCFFVAGGYTMHILESCSRRFTCIPVVHEVAAGVAAEYFNEVGTGGKAFALVTAGPGITNIVTAIAGAYLESRELLVLSGQVKTSDFASGGIRQRGIQEVDGLGIVRPITKAALRLSDIVDGRTFAALIRSGLSGRKGPVFIELPLDIQARNVDPCALGKPDASLPTPFRTVTKSAIAQISERLRQAQRPVILLGGGIDRATTQPLLETLAALGIPLMATWSAADRIPSDHPLYFGRPNTWGQRSSNILMQQSDVLLALGSRLGLQQTGFNWQEFIPKGEVIQVDCDSAELGKGHPKVTLPICGDANLVLRSLAEHNLGQHDEWVAFCREVRRQLPLNEPENETREGFLSPYVFMQRLSCLCNGSDVVIPCSSGGAFTVFMQAFGQKRGQRIVSNKGLAAMGYGLSGAIGAAIAANGQRTVLIEGDGGFIQNFQELGTVAVNKLNLKVFIFDNDGYASIRMTQRNYFSGRYVGCDAHTGLGIPRWEPLFEAYGIPMMAIGPEFEQDAEFQRLFNTEGAAAFVVKIDPAQTYFPKISSRVTEMGSMVSNPLHLMSPELTHETAARVFRYFDDPSQGGIS